MTQTVETVNDANGKVSCPCCGEELGEGNISIPQPRRTRFLGPIGGLWLYTEVECGECGELFEVGGAVGLTKLPEEL